MLKIRDNPYEYDVAILKKYTQTKYKLTLHRTLRKKGLEIPKVRKGTVNNEKLENNISRAKSKIYEYSLCNEFDYFVTLTLNPEKWDTHNLDIYIQKLTQFFRNYGRNHNTRIQYLLIPEKHKSGAWHLHGLIKGILSRHLRKNQNNYYEWKQYTEKFGYMSLGKVKNQDAVSKYITKYITKDMTNTIQKVGAKTYYCSRGLKKAVEIKRGTLSKEFLFQFENEYIKTSTFEIDDDITLNTFLNTIV